jgi:hypothetical protein
VTLSLYKLLALKKAEHLQANQEDPPSDHKQKHTPDAELHMRQNNRRNSKLSRLKPAGAAETLGSMVDNHGNIITELTEMADLLKNHWSNVFYHKHS